MTSVCHLPLKLPATLAFAWLLATGSPVSAVVVIQDTFENGSITTGATVLPGTNWVGNGTTPTESGGKLILDTAGSDGQYRTSGLYTSVTSSNLNIFTGTVGISVREFTLTGDGDHAAPNNRYRIGLTTRDNLTYSNPGSGPAAAGNALGQFYNGGNDGIVLNIISTTNGFNSYQLLYKANSTMATDPNLSTALTGSLLGSLSFAVTGFDLSLSATDWSMTFYGAGNVSTTTSGTWNLAQYESTWGNATDGFGNASLYTDVQTLGQMTASAPVDSFNGHVAATLGELTVTSTPEPSRLLLIMAGTAAVALRRRRALV